MLVAFLAIFLTLILAIGVHEAGHAIAARLAKVKICKVSIGFGRSLLSWRSRTGCEWVWAWCPLGGYVQLANTRIAEVLPKELPHCFDKKPIWIRILILVAGSVSNLILAWFIFILVYSLGFKYQLPIIQSVQPNSIANQAGVLAKDEIIAVGEHKTPSFREVGMRLIEFWGNKDVKITVKQKEGASRVLNFDLSKVGFNFHHNSLMNTLGMLPDLNAKTISKSLSFFDALQEANSSIFELTHFLYIVLKQLISRILPFSVLLGPFGLFSASIASLNQGVVVFMYFIATLSTAVGLINLFPIPGLDGGSIVYAVIEKIRGKPVSIALEVLIHNLFFIVFCLILVQLVLNDG